MGYLRLNRLTLCRKNFLFLPLFLIFNQNIGKAAITGLERPKLPFSVTQLETFEIPPFFPSGCAALSAIVFAFIFGVPLYLLCALLGAVSSPF